MIVNNDNFDYLIYSQIVNTLLFYIHYRRFVCYNTAFIVTTVTHMTHLSTKNSKNICILHLTVYAALHPPHQCLYYYGKNSSPGGVKVTSGLSTRLSLSSFWMFSDAAASSLHVYTLSSAIIVQHTVHGFGKQWCVIGKMLLGVGALPDNCHLSMSSQSFPGCTN